MRRYLLALAIALLVALTTFGPAGAQELAVESPANGVTSQGTDMTVTLSR